MSRRSHSSSSRVAPISDDRRRPAGGREARPREGHSEEARRIAAELERDALQEQVQQLRREVADLRRGRSPHPSPQQPIGPVLQEISPDGHPSASLPPPPPLLTQQPPYYQPSALHSLPGPSNNPTPHYIHMSTLGLPPPPLRPPGPPFPPPNLLLPPLTQAIPGTQLTVPTTHEPYDPMNPMLTTAPVPPQPIPEANDGHPFSTSIMLTPLPPHFKPPTHIGLYDGTTDPQEHLETFRASMLLSGAPDAIMCRAFSTTLKKAGLRWFTSLPRQSIHNFRQLAEAFSSYFAISRAPKKTTASLVNFQQRKGETLKDYLTRFNTLALDIKDLNESVAVHQIITGLRVGHLSLSLAKRPPIMLTDLLARSEKYINVEEIESAQRMVER